MRTMILQPVAGGNVRVAKDPPRGFDTRSLATTPYAPGVLAASKGLSYSRS